MTRLAIFLCRTGIGIVFLYAGIASLLDTTSWVGYFPFFIRSTPFFEIISLSFSIFQILLALWLFSGLRVNYAALTSFTVLLLIVITNITLLDIVFRDIALLFTTLALYSLTRPDPNTTKEG